MCTILVNHNLREHFWLTRTQVLRISFLGGPIQNSLANSVESDRRSTALGYFDHIIIT